MRIKTLTLCRFRCFGGKPTTLEFDDLTAFIGTNGSGKSAALQALSRLFGAPAERRLNRADFHVPPAAEDEEEADELSLSIEARLEFPELAEGGVGGVPECFNQMIVEAPAAIPFCRVRLDAIWRASHQPEGEIEEAIWWVRTAENEVSDRDKVKMNSFDRGRIQVLYVPASRDPARHLRHVAGSLIHPLLKAVQWSDATRETAKEAAEQVQTAFRAEPGMQQIEAAIVVQWTALHQLATYQDVRLQPLSARFADLLRHVEAMFRPGDDARAQPLERLSDGLRSLFYFSLVGARFAIEEAARKPAESDGDESALEFDEATLPALTVFAVEEPENHLAPHYLGRILALLYQLAGRSNAQVLLSSQSPAILGRVAPEQVRHFRLDATRGTASVRAIQLPQEDAGEVYKYVKEAVRAYPELYFASLVVLCEGDSEEIVLPRLATALGLPLDRRFVSVVPLGGRHVNHFWRLLRGLGIPHATLLDLDRERGGGGWGRIQYACQQLLNFSPLLRRKVLADPENAGNELTKEELAAMDEREVTAEEGMAAWIEHLEKFGVFFSAPLDLDFLMLQAFPTEYQATAHEDGGPQIPEEEQAYEKRILRACRAVLKAEGGHGQTYTDEEKEAFIWYSYLFLGRGKPSTHLLALNQLDDDAIGVGIPGVLERLIRRIENILNPAPAE
ncbi:MAG: TOPRIM nucleotidyl transferase/hydrolase domain-containing protein [Chthoniobacterales bacterium]